MKTFVFLVVSLVICFVVMFVFRYKVYDYKMTYRGHSAIQRMDKVTGKMEVQYKSKWIKEEEWKNAVDREIRKNQPKDVEIQYVPTASNLQTVPPVTEIPSWQTPSLSPMTGKTKPVLVTKKARVAGHVKYRQPNIIYQEPRYTQQPNEEQYQSPQQRATDAGAQMSDSQQEEFNK